MDTPGNLVDSPMRGVDFWIRISPRIRSKNRNGLRGSARDLGQGDLCKNINKTGSLPCHFKVSNNFSLFFLMQDNQWTPLCCSTSLVGTEITSSNTTTFSPSWITCKQRYIYGIYWNLTKEHGKRKLAALKNWPRPTIIINAIRGNALTCPREREEIKYIAIIFFHYLQPVGPDFIKY